MQKKMFEKMSGMILILMISLIAICWSNSSSAAQPPWTPINGNENNMIATGNVYFNGTLLNGSGYWLGTYGPDGLQTDCRSVGAVAAGGSYYATIRGNTDGQAIYFMLWNGNIGQAFPAGESLSFLSDDLQEGFNIHCVTAINSINITAPNGGEKWTEGENHNITWSSIGTITNVKIDYSTNNGGSWNSLASNIANDGSYTWLVPNIPSVNCLVWISDAANADTLDTSNAVFTIFNPAAPDVQTLAAASITAVSAVLNGTVNAHGLATTYYFEYGTTTSYGSSTTVISAGSGENNVSVPVSISGLSANTIYHFRLVASNSEGTTEGNDLTFTTTGGGGGGSGEAGGGGGGCFIATAELGLNLWFMVLGMVSGLLVWTRQRAKRLKCHL